MCDYFYVSNPSMPHQRIHNRTKLKRFRKALRNHSTSAEATLWNQLKQRQLCGRKFRRQHSIGDFIIDFYCPEERLAVELDGKNHFSEEGKQKDANRTTYLNSLCVRVIRFENKWVFEDMNFVLTEIRKAFRNPL